MYSHGLNLLTFHRWLQPACEDRYTPKIDNQNIKHFQLLPSDIPTVYDKLDEEISHQNLQFKALNQAGKRSSDFHVQRSGHKQDEYLMIASIFAIQFKLSVCLTISIQNDAMRSGVECLISSGDILKPVI